MKAPYFVVEDDDISIYGSIETLERSLESPDIECYRVFDADGEVLRLTSDTLPPKRWPRLGWVAVGKVKVSRSEPPEAAPDELAKILSDYLARLTGQSCEAADLGELIREIMQHAQVDG